MDFDSYITPIVDFVRIHQAWAAPVVFALCFAESLAFISLLIPAWGVLVGLGALIGASGLNFWPIWVAGSVGAALGDWLSYWIGLKLENRVYHMLGGLSLATENDSWPTCIATKWATSR